MKKILKKVYLKLLLWFYPKKLDELWNKHKHTRVVLNHTPEGVKKWIDGICEYTDIKRGDIDRGQGDIVIINLKQPEYIQLSELLEPIFYVEKIETVGRYTNIFFQRRVFVDAMSTTHRI